jgi:hypothetical protein
MVDMPNRSGKTSSALVFKLELEKEQSKSKQ